MKSGLTSHPEVSADELFPEGTLGQPLNIVIQRFRDYSYYEVEVDNIPTLSAISDAQLIRVNRSEAVVGQHDITQVVNDKSFDMKSYPQSFKKVIFVKN